MSVIGENGKFLSMAFIKALTTAYLKCSEFESANIALCECPSFGDFLGMVAGGCSGCDCGCGSPLSNMIAQIFLIHVYFDMRFAVLSLIENELRGCHENHHINQTLGHLKRLFYDLKFQDYLTLIGEACEGRHATEKSGLHDCRILPRVISYAIATRILIRMTESPTILEGVQSPEVGYYASKAAAYLLYNNFESLPRFAVRLFALTVPKSSTGIVNLDFMLTI